MLKPTAKTVGLDPNFLKTLTSLAANLPFDLVINESIPPTKENSHVRDSEHYDGLGVDVSATDGYARYMIVVRALAEGINRIGIYDKHIHIGASTDLPHPVIWSGISK